ncbi:B-cell receptor CD22-like isoform X2 [Coregonus clupeaformis]|uniref:B-cell receptor CD22-like isoform X2 n=1 Tax=Coregonus clupeaformis TaxID=59861 RepID=UPI001BE0BD4D|nr:B-cell receptor CD22-like isoform X2 [Coregonus clupeaformis]
MSGAGAGSLVLIGCLLRGALCQNGKVLIPSGIQALSGSCVLIPCRFTLKSKYESSLTRPCKGTWNRVFVKPGLMAPTRDDLLQKDCTTILNLPYPYPRSYLSQYFLNLECDKSLPFEFPQSINIDVKDSPPQPTLTPVTVIVNEGESVSLICSAASPCPFLPPTLTWTPRLGDSVEKQEKGPNWDQTEVMTSTLTFTASYLHHGQTMSCTALYKRLDGNSDVSSEKSLPITVQYPPRNTSVLVRPSGSVVEGSSVTLTCSSNAYPAVKSYTWYRVNEDQVAPVKATRVLNVQVSQDNTQFYCEARNELGLQKSAVVQLGVPYKPRNTSVSVSPSSLVVEGSSVTLTCSSNANPAVKTYTWYRVNESKMVPMESRSRSLVLQDISESGLFCCEAQNSYGKEMASIFVYLHHCPSTPTVSVPSIICGVVIVLWILTVIFGVYRYIRLSRGLKSVDDTYTTLEISNVTSTYEVLQRKEHGSRGAQRETSGSDM